MGKRSDRSESAIQVGLLEELPAGTNATTSRVVCDNDLLRVVYFAFDAGQELTEHSSPRAVVVTVLDGRMRFTLGGVEHTMATGDVVYLAPNEPHALATDEPCRISLVMIDAEAATAR